MGVTLKHPNHESEKAEKYLSENGLGYPYTGYVTEQAAERAAGLAVRVYDLKRDPYEK